MARGPQRFEAYRRTGAGTESLSGANLSIPTGGAGLASGLATLGEGVFAAAEEVDRIDRERNALWLDSTTVDSAETIERLAEEHRDDPATFRARAEAAIGGLAEAAPDDETRQRFSAAARRQVLPTFRVLNEREEARRRESLEMEGRRVLDGMMGQAADLARKGRYEIGADGNFGGEAGDLVKRIEARVEEMVRRGELTGNEGAAYTIGVINRVNEQLAWAGFDQARRGGVDAALDYVEQVRQGGEGGLVDPDDRLRVSNAMRASLATDRARQSVAEERSRRDVDFVSRQWLKGRRPVNTEEVMRSASPEDQALLARVISIADGAEAARKLPLAELDAIIAERQSALKGPLDATELDVLEDIRADRVGDIKARTVFAAGQIMRGRGIEDEAALIEEARVADPQLATILEQAQEVRAAGREAPEKTVAQLNEEIAALTRSIEDEGDADKLSVLQAIRNDKAKALETVDGALDDARSAGEIEVPPIVVQDQDTIRDSLAARVRAGEEIRVREGLDYVPILDSRETERIRTMLATGTPAEQAIILQGLVSGAGAYGPEILRSVGSKSPPHWVAGSLMAAGRTAAGTEVLRGLAVREHQPAFVPPQDAHWWTEFRSAVPDEVLSALPPQVRGGVEDSIQAAYVSLAQRAGKDKSTVDAQLLEDARDLVLGGVVEYGRWRTVAPRPGMTSDQFEALIDDLSDADVAAAKTASGTSVRADDIRDSGRLVWRGSGLYHIEWTGPDGGRVTAVGPDGGPFVLDLMPGADP